MKTGRKNTPACADGHVTRGFLHRITLMSSRFKRRNHLYRGRRSGGRSDVETPLEIPPHSNGTFNWTNETGFEKDVFTFVHIIRNWSPYDSPSAASWITDFPDIDLNMLIRLQQMISLRADPDGRVIRPTDRDLFNCPWIYMVEPDSLLPRDEEVPLSRKYLLTGGVLMADNFWGEGNGRVFRGRSGGRRTGARLFLSQAAANSSCNGLPDNKPVAQN